MRSAASPGSFLGFGPASHALVTGCAPGGIGVATVRALLAHGCGHVTAAYGSRAPPDDVAQHERCTALSADLCDEHAVAQLFERARSGAPEHAKAVTLLVVNHGVFPKASTSLADTKLEDWQRVHTINVNTIRARTYEIRKK